MKKGMKSSKNIISSHGLQCYLRKYMYDYNVMHHTISRECVDLSFFPLSYSSVFLVRTFLWNFACTKFRCNRISLEKSNPDKLYKGNSHHIVLSLLKIEDKCEDVHWSEALNRYLW